MADFLHRFPELCLFLSIVLGHVIGRFHFKGVGLGVVVGTLVSGMLIGIVGHPELPDLLRWAFFYLFLFSIGYSVGPQFFGSLKREALPQIVLSLVVAFAGLATIIVVTAIFGFDEGIAVGLLSGGMTQSAALGTGLNAIAELPLPAELKTTLSAHAPLGDAITYGFGDLGLILFLTWIGPAILKADLRREAKVLEETMSGGKPAGGDLLSMAHFGFRGYEVVNPAIGRSSLESFEKRYASSRLSVLRLQRGDELLAIDPSVTLQPGDRVVVGAARGAFKNAEQDIGPEIDDPDLLSVPLKSASIVVTNRDLVGQTLAQLAADPRSRGVYLGSIKRGTEMLPRQSWTSLERGDILRVFGAPDDVERVGKHVGFVEKDLSKTDLAFLAAGICAGILLGLLKIPAGGVRLGLGTAGSILLIGLAAGWARSRYPVFGAIPEPAQRLLMDIGLIVFIAIVGLHAGPHGVAAYRESGGAFFASIFTAGMIVTTVPLAAGLIVGRYVLKMNPLMLIGGLAGAQTCTPGLTALREASGSNVVSLAYTVPYAIGNILLTIWGPVVVAIVHAMRGAP